MKTQVIKVVASKDFRFVHIAAGLDHLGRERIYTEASEEAVVNHIVQPGLEEFIKQVFPDIRRAYDRDELAIQIRIKWL